jgi:CBS domain-containing protein
MTSDLVCVGPRTDLEECMKLMTEHRVRHLPVLQEVDLVGIVSIGDIVRFLAAEREHTIQELTEYIQGRYA